MAIGAVVLLVIVFAARRGFNPARGEGTPPAMTAGDSPRGVDRPIVPGPMVNTAPPETSPSVTQETIAQLKAQATQANEAYTAAIMKNAPDAAEGLRTFRAAVDQLGMALYRYHVTDGHGTREAAQREMETFLRGLDSMGLGLSEDEVTRGVSRVAR
ncbi:MAG: hypothetical protein NTY02_11050 [Acidobacteria bacterium]|nr:hypothetical protein [Acidobacteriota bacterium]